MRTPAAPAALRSKHMLSFAVACACLAAVSSLRPAVAQTVNPPSFPSGAPGAANQGTEPLPLGMTVLGPSVGTLVASDSRLVYSDSEAARGVDLNGDGDATDLVMGTYDAATRTRDNLGGALGTIGDIGYGGKTTHPVAEGDTVVIKVGEKEQGGIDLNGDGDAEDVVYYLYDAGTDTYTATLLTRHEDAYCDGTGYGICSAIVDIEGSWAALQASEDGFVDLNGDGDTSDDTVHILVNARTGEVVNSGFSAGSGFGAPTTRATVGEDLAFLPVSETSSGNVDLNGNGFVGDGVIVILELQTGATTVIDLVPFRYRDTTVAPVPDGFVFVASEYGVIDLNGDGDTFDEVLHAYEHSTGTITNLGFAVSEVKEKAIGSSVRVYLTETGQGQDLNGDGDSSDLVLGLYDHVANTLTNTGMAASLAAGESESRALHMLWEPAQGQTDLNGDGDANDYVPVLIDGDAGTVTMLPVAVTAHYTNDLEQFVQGDLLMLPVSEPDQGALDINGDGDADDSILHVLNLETLDSFQSPHALGGTLRSPVGGGFLYYGASEADSGGVDLNGDGDAFDAITQAIDLTTFTVHNLRIPFSTVSVPLGGELAASVVEWHFGQDLNRDGDTSDAVLVLIDPLR